MQLTLSAERYKKRKSVCGCVCGTCKSRVLDLFIPSGGAGAEGGRYPSNRNVLNVDEALN